MGDSLGMDQEREQVVVAPPSNPDLRWYIVHAYSGMEKAVERNITELDAVGSATTTAPIEEPGWPGPAR